MLRTQHHERHAVDGVGTRGEYLKARHWLRVKLWHIGLGTGQHVFIAFHFQREPHCSTLRTAYPVALYLFQRVGPVHLLQSVDQTLGIGRHAQAPLAHQFAFHGVTAAHAQPPDDLVVGQHGSKLGTPVHRYVGKVGQAVVHKHLTALGLVPAVPLLGREVQHLGAGGVELFSALLGKALFELADGHSLLQRVVVVVLEKLQEGPLRPLVVLRLAGTHLAVPIETEAYLVQLLAVARYVLLRGHCGVLTSLYGILLRGQTVGIVAHGVQHIIAAQTLVARVDVARYIAQRVPHMEAGARRVGKHVQNIVMRLVAVVVDMVHTMLAPPVLPPRFEFTEVVVHFLSIYYNPPHIRQEIAKIRNIYIYYEIKILFYQELP